MTDLLLNALPLPSEYVEECGVREIENREQRLNRNAK